MGAKREYTAIFSIGARLLGSFRGAFAAAQARMKRLQAASLAVGKSLMRFGTMFTTLFAGAGAFAVGAVLRKIFEGTDEAAAAAEQRTRKLTAALMTQNNIRAKGREYAVEQTKELSAQLDVIASQGVFSKGMLEAAAGTLALQKLGPKEIAKTIPLLADVLVASEGINATQEQMQKLALAFGKGVLTGTLPRSAMKYIGSFSVAEAKKLKELAKAGKMQEAYDFLMARLQKFAGESARALKTPEGRIKRLDIAMAKLRKNIGLATLEARAKMADAWSKVLPKLEPFFIGIKKMSADAMGAFAEFIERRGVPALEAISKWAAGPGADAWNKMKSAWSDMSGKIGAALGRQFEALAGKGRNLGDVVVTAMDSITASFKWIGDNSSWLVPTLEGIAVALAAISIISFISVNAGLLTLVGTVGLAAGAFGKASNEYQKFKDLMAGEAVSDPEHFTKHWYLMNQSWTEVFAGLTGVVENFKAGWDKSINELKAKWDWLVESIRLFKMPAWWDKFWSRQSSEAEKQLKFAEERRALEEQSAAVQPKPQVVNWRKTAAEDYAALQAAVEAVRKSEARMLALPLGREGKPRLPGIVQQALPTTMPVRPPTTPQAPGRGAFIAPQVAEILPFWKRTTENLAGDWKETWKQMGGDTAQITPGLEATGNNLKTQILTPIQEIMRNWSMLATAMGTPVAIPAAAAAAATGPGGLPAPDIPPDTTGVPGYASGGVVSRPTLAMIGERGPEAVIPLRGRGGAQTSVNFAPVVNISGNASATEQAAMDSKLRDLARDFIADFKRAQNNERRLSYEGGYG